MGVSRSATIILAYLLWSSHRFRSTGSAPTPQVNPAPNKSRVTPPLLDQPLTPETALNLLRQGRPSAEPNDGFMEQLRLYHSLACPDSIDSQPQYQRWLYQRTVKESLDSHRAPQVDAIRFEDKHDVEDLVETGTSGGIRESHIRCRKCRRLLAESKYLIEHKPPPPPPPPPNPQQQLVGDTKDCAHLFLHPLSWMREALKEGELDGRLGCPNPKCGANVGKFAWQGMRCNCGKWVTPGFGLARGKVDEVAVSTRMGREVAGGAETEAVAAVRLPPSMRSQGGPI